MLAFVIFLLLFAAELAKGQQSAAPFSLDCVEFDSSCQWLNANTASASNSTLVWYRSSTPINPDQMMMTTGTNAMPNGSYAIASTVVVDTANATQRALLMSGVVPCQNVNATLNFTYWTSPFVLLNICAKPEGLMLNKSSDCQRGPVTQGPGPASILIAPMKRPFRILIEASNFVYSNGGLTGGFAILDNVVYTGDYCRNVTTTTKAPNSTAIANSTGVMSNTTLASVTATTLATTPRAATSNATAAGR